MILYITLLGTNGLFRAPFSGVPVTELGPFGLADGTRIDLAELRTKGSDALADDGDLIDSSPQ